MQKLYYFYNNIVGGKSEIAVNNLIGRFYSVEKPDLKMFQASMREVLMCM